MKKSLVSILLIALSLSFAVDKGIPVFSLLEGLRDGSDNQLASGTVQSYIAGTTTAKDLYTDANKTNIAANPLTLDSNGKATVWAKDDGFYKLITKTSSGTTVDVWDNLFFGTALNDIDNRPIGGTNQSTGKFTDLTIKNDSNGIGLSWDDSSDVEGWSIKKEAEGLDFDLAGVLAMRLTGNGIIAPTLNVSSILTITTINAGFITANEISSGGQHRVLVFTPTAFSVPNGSSTAVTFDAEIYDVGGLHATGSAMVTTQKAGFYHILAQVGYAANNTGYRICEIDISDVTYALNEGVTYQTSAQGTVTYMQASVYAQLAAGVNIQLLAFQNSGGALNTAINPDASFLNVVRLY
jgi:hypothetical protein